MDENAPLLWQTLKESAQRLQNGPRDYDALLQSIGEAQFVLIGEASHGTHEFYAERAEITKRLIREKGFSAVVIEADWPDAYRVNRFLRGDGNDSTGEAALSGFQRFPSWMWRNTDVMAFINWLRDHNATCDGTAQVGLYGMDLYSLFASMEAVVKTLETLDPQAAQRARERYSCFDHFGENSQKYGYSAGLGLSKSCETEVVKQLTELQRMVSETLQTNEDEKADALFFARQNARLVKNAERYYRAMFQDRVSSWNLRDEHMVQTINTLVDHLSRRQPRPKLVVWAHNSHLGDASQTEMRTHGEWNVGELLRRQVGNDAFLIGFSTYTGTVTAASDWGSSEEKKRVRPALRESYEYLFHGVGIERFLLDLRGSARLKMILREPRLERAIGVIYLPHTERTSHYFEASLSGQFDALIHIDETTAVEPLEPGAQWHRDELPQTYPSAV